MRGVASRHWALPLPTIEDARCVHVDPSDGRLAADRNQQAHAPARICVQSGHAIFIVAIGSHHAVAVGCAPATLARGTSHAVPLRYEETLDRWLSGKTSDAYGAVREHQA